MFQANILIGFTLNWNLIKTKPEKWSKLLKKLSGVFTVVRLLTQNSFMWEPDFEPHPGSDPEPDACMTPRGGRAEVSRVRPPRLSSQCSFTDEALSRGQEPEY